ncbi:M20 aminoacylase family protein [Plastoroseomonas hellenica]|uniref:M20 aminoacylase family protein n=1 Tax=Plastoroseomonas hellenica TaxID=2687306 RepID=UPI001BA6F66C|nr:M20 aminoacylase family protein [Plastoroseomonas hellenica]MBR0642800.1 amidohydrolase [Plastoroseomonas hellenica]
MGSDDTKARIEAILPDLLAVRRDIHAHPELGFEETRTAALVAEKLRSWGIETTEGVGRTGVVGTVRGTRPGQGAIGLRCDMDCLALIETTGLPYASTTAGRMHACGHDGHTTMLLGAARLLAERRDFAGTVHLIFQPAEEGRGGAVAMLEDGLFDRFPCDAVYGMHNMPGVPVGQFAIRKGPLMAASGRFTVTFRGTGGHGGNSAHLATDVMVSQAMYVQALQTIVSRNVPALESAVISLGHIAAGSPEALNVMPSELVLGGTMRAFNPEMQALLERRMTELAHLCAAAAGTTAEVMTRWGTIPMINAERETDVSAAAAKDMVGAVVDEAVAPVTGGEDFSFMVQRKPGAMIFLGNGVGADSHALHTPKYDFNDAALPFGVAWWLGVVRQELGA